MAPHLTLEEREVVAEMLQQGYSCPQIAASLGRDPTTIRREIRRNHCLWKEKYWASYAHALAQARRRRARQASCKMNRPEIGRYVQEHLCQAWSPEQIAGRLRRDFPEDSRRRISYQAIYAWLAESDHGRQWRVYLRRWRPRQRRPRPAERVARSLRQRPEEINSRARYGDWEGDTIVGPRRGGPVLVSLVERKSGYLELAWATDATAASVQRIMLCRWRAYPAELTRSATFDNGSEFAQAKTLEETLQMAVFFADPRAPYQRGTNENTNGLVRQYFPKGTGFRTVSRYKVAQVQELLDHRPRKRLRYRTPHEVMQEERYRAFQT